MSMKEDPLKPELDEHNLDLLVIAALFEGEFSIDWIEEISEQKPSQILWSFEDAISEGMLAKTSPGKFIFEDAEAKVRIQGSLSLDVVERLRRRIVDTLIRETTDDVNVIREIAGQLLKLSNSVEHCDWLLKAGHIYRKAFSHKEASKCYLKIIQYLKDEKTEQLNRVFIDAAIGLSKISTYARNFETVISALSDALKRAKSEQWAAEESLLEMHLAGNEWLRNRFPDAFAHFKRGWSIAKDIDDPKLIRSHVTFTSFFHMWEGRYSDVIKDYQEFEPEISKHPYGRFPLQAGVALGHSYALTGQVTRGLGMLDAIRNHSREIGDIHTASLAGYVIGVILLEISKVEKGLRYLKDALAEAIQGENNWAKIWALLAIAFAYYLTDDSDKALSCLDEFLDLQSESDMTILSPYLLEFCWAIEQGKFPSRAGLSLEREIRNATRCRNLSTKGIGYRYQGLKRKLEGESPQKVIGSFLLSKKWLEKADNKIRLGQTLIELAHMYLSIGKNEKAQKTMRLAAENLSPINDKLIPDDLRPLIKDFPGGKTLLKEIFKLGQELVIIRNNKKLFRRIISTVNRITGAERGAIFLFDNNSVPPKTVLRAAQNLTKEDIEQPHFASSMEIIQNAATTGKGKIHLMHSEQTFGQTSSNNIRSCICVPMKFRDEVVGVLYHDNRLLSSAFETSDLEVLEYFAAQAAIAMDNSRAYEKIELLNEKLKEEKQYYEEQHLEAIHFEDIVGKSTPFLATLDQVKRVAGTDTTVLILGETGVGKELIAWAIHRNSPRCDKPFIRVNCSALPESLISSELFGHEKGAFTGATNRRVGRFELADGGTLFLDEIGDISMEIQVHLLRVLQSKEFERIGGKETICSDFRLLTATNRDLSKAVQARRFRQDLYYRLSVFPIHVPPLRDRKEDIPLLSYYFLRLHAAKLGRPTEKIPQSEMEKLLEYNWPGNVRELENVIERGMILSSGELFKLPEELGTEQRRAFSLVESPTLNLKENERRLIVTALSKTNGKLSGRGGAAEILGLHPNTLYSRMKNLGIRRSRRG